MNFKFCIISISTIVLAFTLLHPKTTRADEGNRIALIIGNSSYQTAPLRNPVNDVNSIEKSLNLVNFRVTKLTDVNYYEFKNALNTFAKKISARTTVLFYFSGHGLQYNGENYLAPIETVNTNNEKLIRLNDILKIMEQASSGIKLVFLDACRSLPARNTLTRQRTSIRQNGLATINGAVGTVISFATAPGKTASDGIGQNSPYTAALSKTLLIKDIPIEEMLKRTRNVVMRLTDNKQITWDHSSLVGRFYFRPYQTLALGAQQGQNVNNVISYIDVNKNNINAKLALLIKNKKFKKARALANKLVAHKNKDATLSLALLNLYGLGSAKDPKTAIRLLKLAVSFESDKAAYTLGVLYLTGKIVSRNITRGKDWLERASNLGNDKAKQLLIRISHL